MAVPASPSTPASLALLPPLHSSSSSSSSSSKVSIGNLFVSSSRGHNVSPSSVRRGLNQVNAAVSTVDQATLTVPSKEKKLLLEVRDLTAVIAETKQEILKGVNLAVYEGGEENGRIVKDLVGDISICSSS